MELCTEDAMEQGDGRGRHRADKQSVLGEKRVRRNPPNLCPAPPLYGEAEHSVYSSLEPLAGNDAGGVPPDCGGGGSSKGQSPSEGAPDNRQGKRKHRRRPSKNKRRWKPYFKLTWEEKKELGERESARASRVRAEMFAKGLPVAPYNTTQFLMEEHDREEPDLNTEPGGGGGRKSEDTGTGSEEECCFEPEEDDDDEREGGGSDGMGRAGSAGGEFLQRDFSETYERYHVETLQNMSKQELVREYLELEKSLSRLEDENNWLRRARRNSDESAQRVRELEGELERARALNAELQASRGRQSAVHAPNGSAEEPDTGRHTETALGQ